MGPNSWVKSGHRVSGESLGLGLVQGVGLKVGDLGSVKGNWAQRREFELSEETLVSVKGIWAQWREFGLREGNLGSLKGI